MKSIRYIERELENAVKTKLETDLPWIKNRVFFINNDVELILISSFLTPSIAISFANAEPKSQKPVTANFSYTLNITLINAQFRLGNDLKGGVSTFDGSIQDRTKEIIESLMFSGLSDIDSNLCMGAASMDSITSREPLVINEAGRYYSRRSMAFTWIDRRTI